MKRVIKLVGVVLLQLLFFSVNAAQFKAVDIAHDKDYGYQVSDEFSRTKGTSERFEVRHGDCAGEDCWRDRQRYEVGITQPYNEDDHWYGWSFYLPNNFMIQPAGTAMGQAKLIGGTVLWMVLTKHTDYIQIKSDTYEQECNLIKTDNAIGKWTDIMIRANYSSNSKKPLDVWVNGKNVGCNYANPLVNKKKLQVTSKYKKGLNNEVAFKYGVYQSFISRWLDKRKTKKTSGNVDVDYWKKPSGKCCKSPDNTPFDEDWGVKLPTAVMYYDAIRVGRSRDAVNIFYDDATLDLFESQLAEESKSSPLFDGRYSFDLFRYHDDDDDKYLGWGFIEIRNGEITIDKHSKSYLKTGSTDLYDTFSGQINKEGEISSSVELDILKGKDRSEIYHLKGKVGEKIWGDSPREDFYRIYMSLVKE
jgi:hypothetical protein